MESSPSSAERLPTSQSYRPSTQQQQHQQSPYTSSSRSSVLPPSRSTSVPPPQTVPSVVSAKPNTSLETLNEATSRDKPESSSSQSFGKRLRKAFTFGSSTSSSKSTAVSKQCSVSSKLTTAGRSESDTRSLFSVRSSASTASFATLRKVGGKFSRGTQSLFRHKRRESDEISLPGAPDFADNVSSPAPGPTAIPVVTHAVAEAEIQSISTSLSVSRVDTADDNTPRQSFMDSTNAESQKVDDEPQFAVLSVPPTDSQLMVPDLTVENNDGRNSDDDANSIQEEIPVVVVGLVESGDADPIPSLTSSTESSNNDSEEVEEDLAAGDTVFPKKLDLLTVETIRSSLERTKSLERRRSRRSSKAAVEEERKQEILPNATEIRVQNVDLADVDLDAAPPKGILKSSSASTVSRGEDSTLDGKSYHSLNSTTETLDGTIESPNIDIDFGEPSLDLDFAFDRISPSPSPDMNEEHRTSQESAFSESSRGEGKQYRDESAVAAATQSKRLSTVSFNSKHSGRQGEQVQQFHYHPLYQQRMSQYHTYGSLGGARSLSDVHLGHSKSGSTASGSTVTFSSRIVIYNTYGPSDYDRRPDLATCNRLTPLLAQQIKEELNTFKMEMEIHRDSRVFTHFF